MAKPKAHHIIVLIVLAAAVAYAAVKLDVWYARRGAAVERELEP